MVRNRLFTKFLRDIGYSKGQLLSVILLSMLGVWVFSGLDAYWRSLDTTVECYFEEQRLADFWITLTMPDEDAEEKIRSIDGVEDVQGRLSFEVSTAVPAGAKLMLHTVSDDITINVPRITNGGPLRDNDSEGCLLDEWFAEASHGRPRLLDVPVSKTVTA